MKAAIDRRFALVGRLLCNDLRRDDLEGKRNGGKEGEKRVDNRSLTKSSRAQVSRYNDVGDEVGRNRHPRSRKEDETSPDDTGRERLRLLGQTMYHAVFSGQQQSSGALRSSVAIQPAVLNPMQNQRFWLLRRAER